MLLTHSSARSSKAKKNKTYCQIKSFCETHLTVQKHSTRLLCRALILKTSNRKTRAVLRASDGRASQSNSGVAAGQKKVDLNRS